jgi:hypothetical protein
MFRKLFLLILFAGLGVWPIEGMKRGRESDDVELSISRKKPKLEHQNASIVTWNPKSLKALCTQEIVHKLARVTGSTIDGSYSELFSPEKIPLDLQEHIKNNFRAYYGWRLGAYSSTAVDSDLPKDLPCLISSQEADTLFLVDNNYPGSTVEFYFSTFKGVYDHAIFPCYKNHRLDCTIAGIACEQSGARLIMYLNDKTMSITTCYPFEYVLCLQAKKNSNLKDLCTLFASEMFKKLPVDLQYKLQRNH